MTSDGMTANFGWVPPNFSCHCCHYFLYLYIFSASSLLSLLAVFTASRLNNTDKVNKTDTIIITKELDLILLLNNSNPITTKYKNAEVQNVPVVIP